MLSANNLLRPQDGHPVTVPTQDMILGSYYLTYLRLGKAETGAETVFVTDAGETALPAGEVVDADDFVAANKAARAEGKREAASPARPRLRHQRRGPHGLQRARHRPARAHHAARGKDHQRPEGAQDGAHERRPASSSTSRYRRTWATSTAGDPEHAFDPEIGFQVGKKQLGDIIDRCIQSTALR